MGILDLFARLLVDAQRGRKPQTVFPDPHGAAGTRVDVDGDVADAGIVIAVFVQSPGIGFQRPSASAAAMPVTAAEDVLLGGEVAADGVGDDIGENHVVVRRDVPHDVAHRAAPIAGIAPDGALVGKMLVALSREASEIVAVALLLFEGRLLAPHFIADRYFGKRADEGFAAKRRSGISRSRERRHGRSMFALGAEQRDGIGRLRKGGDGIRHSGRREQQDAQESSHRSAASAPADAEFSYQSKSMRTVSRSSSSAARVSAVTCRMYDSPVDLTIYSTVLPLPIPIE